MRKMSGECCVHIHNYGFKRSNSATAQCISGPDPIVFTMKDDSTVLFQCEKCFFEDEMFNNELRLSRDHITVAAEHKDPSC